MAHGKKTTGRGRKTVARQEQRASNRGLLVDEDNPLRLYKPPKESPSAEHAPAV